MTWKTALWVCELIRSISATSSWSKLGADWNSGTQFYLNSKRQIILKSLNIKPNYTLRWEKITFHIVQIKNFTQLTVCLCRSGGAVTAHQHNTGHTAPKKHWKVLSRQRTRVSWNTCWYERELLLPFSWFLHHAKVYSSSHSHSVCVNAFFPWITVTPT